MIGEIQLPYTAVRIKGMIEKTGSIKVKPTGLAGLQLDCNAATGDFTLSLSPANLTANRRWTLPNRDDTVAGILSAQSFAGIQTFTDTTDATSTTAAALVVSGGVGIAKQLRVGNLLTTTVADGATGMKIKAGTGMFRFRPYVDATNGCVIDSSDAAETAYLPFTISALNLRLFGNSGVGVSVGTTGIVQCGSSLEVNSATLIKSNTTLTDGAAAAVGTLTNAPTAGNPTKWVLINDNGVIRKFPTWT
jgi:hypothetical protein